MSEKINEENMTDHHNPTIQQLLLQLAVALMMTLWDMAVRAVTLSRRIIPVTAKYCRQMRKIKLSTLEYWFFRYCLLALLTVIATCLVIIVMNLEKAPVRKLIPKLRNTQDQEPPAPVHEAKLTKQKSDEAIINTVNADTLPPKFPMILIIPSSATRYENRLAVRATWGNRTLLTSQYGMDIIGPYFFLGKHDENAVKDGNYEVVSKAIADEKSRFKDIIQLESLDEFQLLTRKMLDIFQWLVDNVLDEKKLYHYILKADDDTYVNIAEIIRSIMNHGGRYDPGGSYDRAFHCRLIVKAKVIRKSDSKYFVPKNVYGDDYYPTYCSGITYAFQASLLNAIVEQASKMELLPNEDTFITGIVAQELHLWHRNLDRSEPWLPAGTWDKKDLCAWAVRSTGRANFRSVFHAVNSEEMAAVHKCVEKPTIAKN